MFDDTQDLTLRLEEANVAPAVAAQISKLKEIEKLVKKGIVSQDVYDKLIEDVIAKNANGAIKRKNLSKVKRAGRISKLKRAMRGSRNKRNKRIVSSGVSGIESSTETKKTLHLDEDDKVEVKKRLLVDKLFRLCQDSKGNTIWKTVEAVLDKEYLDVFSVTEHGKLKDEIKLEVSKLTSIDSVMMNVKLARKTYSIKAREAETIFKQPFVFVLSCQNDHFFFATETEEVKNLWLTTVRKLINSNRRNIGTSANYRQVETSKAINYKEMEREALAEQARLRKQIEKTDRNIRAVSDKYEENDTNWKRRFLDLGFSMSSLDEV